MFKCGPSAFAECFRPNDLSKSSTSAATIMPENGQPLLTVSTNEDAISDRPQRLARSPHPYHRRGPSFSCVDGNISPAADHGQATVLATPGSIKEQGAEYFDADHRKRRKFNDSPSDSGTEADDEKGVILLGLPAPPVRPRKGLKDSKEAASPLLTPSYLDDERRQAAWEVQTRRQASLQNPSADEESSKIREKFTRRRQAELIRRITETLLLVVVCYISARDYLVWPLGYFISTSEISSSLIQSHGLEHTPVTVGVYLAVVLGLYALYPLRIIIKNHARNAARRKSRLYIHLPAAFDPAPLLYPVLLPVMVAWSIAEGRERLLLPNMMLGIASIPRRIIPFGTLQWYNSPQWILTVFPLLASSISATKFQVERQEVWPESSINEQLTLLFPLHQALLPELYHLTTTSLLPSELQLFSTCLVNSLLLSRSPQALILQSILWIGGVSLVVLCSRVLRWGVALARIPSWRFRKPRIRTRRSVVILETLDDSLYGGLSRLGLVSTGNESSEEEDDYDHARSTLCSSRKLLRIRTNTLDAKPPVDPLHHVSTTPLPSLGDSKAAAFPDAGPEKSSPGGQRLRRNTLPTHTNPSLTDDKTYIPTYIRKFGVQSNVQWSFRSLTASQATLLRWIFALYVYSAIVAVVALPVRHYVSRHALWEHEPVGWALGYLFGDVPTFRALTRRWNLGHWVPLPPKTKHDALLLSHLGLMDAYRVLLGPAKIRLLICAYCLIIIAMGLIAVFQLSASVEVDTRRKVFHGMMVAMFLPTIFIDPAFISLAFIVILALFLLLDLFRASQLPPIARPLTYFLAPYVDGRDHRGPVIVSHIFLLIGCAIPLWLSLAAISRTGVSPWEGWELATRDISMISGIVCVGMGDAAASLIGRRFGRRRWCWSGGKSLEGSFAFAAATVLGLSIARAWLLVGGWDGDSGDSWKSFWAKALIAGSGASLTEAVLTGGNDNVIVPVILWLLVRGLSI